MKYRVVSTSYELTCILYVLGDDETSIMSLTIGLSSARSIHHSLL